MTENEKNNPAQTKQKIRDRYRGIDTSELEIIPAKSELADGNGATKRVAAYCRVSTENDEQTSSFELQKNYFTEYIQNQPGWELVDVYADEGISGTSINHREGLQKLLQDCRDGKIDIIITKSIARFARNIVDCLNMIEELRNLKPPVGVIFETDHIDTLGGNDSLLLSIMASLAETESFNKSVIMNWSVENRFKRGIFLLPELIGYDKDDEGNLIINPDEADTVRLCFYLFIAGFTPTDIAELLTDLDRKTGWNKQHNKLPGVEPEYKTEWSASSVISILRNERHCGDVLARKTYTPNFKDHKAKKNTGQREQVRKRDDHERIVSREVWEAANRKLDQMNGKQDRPLPILKVIDEGVLCGYVPVDRNWGGFTADDFKIASESVYREDEIEKSVQESILAGYHVARAQLFSTYLNPAVTISSGRIKFNTACLRRFEDVEYVELLLNSVSRCLAIRPCESNNPNAISWGCLKDGKWIVREKSCRGFAAPLFQMMDWNTELKYRMRGSYVSDGEDRLMLFDLEDFEEINRVQVETVPIEPDQREIEDARPQKPKYKNVISYPERWRNSFGRTYEEDALYLEKIHYSGNWDVFRPAREVFGVNPITEAEIDTLLHEAEKIIERIRESA